MSGQNKILTKCGQNLVLSWKIVPQKSLCHHCTTSCLKKLNGFKIRWVLWIGCGGACAPRAHLPDLLLRELTQS